MIPLEPPVVRSLRLTAMCLTLRPGDRIDTKKLARDLGVSPRTIQRDLAECDRLIALKEEANGDWVVAYTLAHPCPASRRKED